MVEGEDGEYEMGPGKWASCIRLVEPDQLSTQVMWWGGGRSGERGREAGRVRARAAAAARPPPIFAATAAIHPVDRKSVV